MKINLNKGITLIEIMIVVTVVVIVSAIVVLSLSSFRNEQALKNTTVEIVSLLNKARQKTLSSVNSTNYGVHFESDKAVVFAGSVYSAAEPSNEVVEFNHAVTIPVVGGLDIGGGNDVVFQRLTGGTNGGTIIIKLVSDNTKQKIITLNKTGIISSN